jgi:DNA-directed RNA polymerase specialized sigma subunit
LDYEYELDDGDKVTVGDIQVGDEDVDFVDTDYIYRHLTPREKNVVDLVRYGLTYREVGEVCGVSRTYVWHVIRKVRNIMEVHNGNN